MDRTVRDRSSSLRQTAAIIFALVATVPLLIFALTLHTAGVMDRGYAQVALALALAVALLGFYVFSVLMRRVSQLVGELGRAAASQRRGADVLSPAGEAGTRPTGAARSSGGRDALPLGRDGSGARVPVVGPIRELGELADMVSVMWEVEARRHQGRRVAISAHGASEPLVGVLTDTTGQGLVLRLGDEDIALSYTRVVAIEPAPPDMPT